MASKRTKYPYPLVEIQWLDAETSHGWETVAEKIPLVVPVVTTVGFLIEESEDAVRVASTIGDDKSHNARITIPRGMVKAIKTL